MSDRAFRLAMVGCIALLGFAVYCLGQAVLIGVGL